MSGYNHFDYVPSSTSKNRSVFKFHKPIATSGEVGHLYPMCKPVRMLPGSSLKLDFACEIRSGAMIAPLMDEFYMDIYAFNVPNRIVWEHWKQFLGSVDDVLFDNLSEYTIPAFKYCGVDIGLSDDIRSHSWHHMLANYFELPYLKQSQLGEGDTNVETLIISALPFRGYNFIWNEYFRPEQLVNPILFSKTDSGYSGDNLKCTPMGITWNGVGNGYFMILPYSNSSDVPISGGAVLPTFRVHKSLWTSCLPKPSLETLNLLGDLQAPVGLLPDSNDSGIGSNIYPALISGTAVTANVFKGAGGGVNFAGNANTNGSWVADLSQAVLTLNNYLETRMLQNYYNTLNRAGSRYDEIIRNLFHTVSPAAIIDIPELIVHKRFTIYRKQVVANASTLFGESKVQMLGQQAGYIDSVVKDSFFTKSTTEHGYIHLLWTIRPAMIRMSNGIEPEWMQLAKFDQYYSCFDGMGDVVRKKLEVFVPDTVSPDITSIFGYQEYGAEYKYQRASATGQLGCYSENNLSYFTLCEKLSAQPVLVSTNPAGFGSYVSCIVEAEAFARVLAISSPMVSQPFVLDIRLDGEIVHPMPVYNIPGQGELL